MGQIVVESLVIIAPSGPNSGGIEPVSCVETGLLTDDLTRRLVSSPQRVLVYTDGEQQKEQYC